MENIEKLSKDELEAEEAAIKTEQRVLNTKFGQMPRKGFNSESSRLEERLKMVHAEMKKRNIF